MNRKFFQAMNNTFMSYELQRYKKKKIFRKKTITCLHFQLFKIFIKMSCKDFTDFFLLKKIIAQ